MGVVLWMLTAFERAKIIQIGGYWVSYDEFYKTDLKLEIFASMPYVLQ